jgi:hypothetical protein
LVYFFLAYFKRVFAKKPKRYEKGKEIFGSKKATEVLFRCGGAEIPQAFLPRQIFELILANK